MHKLCIMNFTLIAKKQIVMIQVEKKSKVLFTTSNMKQSFWKYPSIIFILLLTFIVKIEFQGFYLLISVG